MTYKQILARNAAWKRKKKLEEQKNNSLILGAYKLPLTKVEKGFGYVGALSFDTKGKIQCHICGVLCESLSSHMVKQHKMNPKKYREKFKLASGTALISEEYRYHMKMSAIKRWAKMPPEKLAEIRKKRKERWKEWFKNKRSNSWKTMALETKNKRGVCPDQLLHLIKECKKSIGRVPSKSDFENHYDTKRYEAPIRRTFGSWAKAISMAGFKPVKKGERGQGAKKFRTREELLELLRIQYEETGKPPAASDCRRGLIPAETIYMRYFGSFPEARRLAGIPKWEDQRPEMRRTASQRRLELQSRNDTITE